MREFELLELIHYKVLSMDINEQIGLLKDCLESLNSMQVVPGFKDILQSFLKPPCYVDEDTYRLLKVIFKKCGIAPTNISLLINGGKPSQVGGDPLENVVDNEKSQVVPGNRDNENSQAVPGNRDSENTIQQNVFGPAPPLGGLEYATAPLSPIECMMAAMRNPNLTPEERMAIINYAGNMATQLVNASTASDIANADAIASRTRNNDMELQFTRRFEGVGLTFAVTTPGIALHYLRESLSSVAVGAVNIAANIAGGAAGFGELAVRNVLAGVIQGAVNMGRIGKRNIPEFFVPEFFVGVGRQLAHSPAAQFADKAVLGAAIEDMGVKASEATDATILFGVIIFYIALVLLLSIVVIVISKLRSFKKVGVTVGVPGIWRFSASTIDGGKRGKRGKRRTKRRNHNSKKTRRRRVYTPEHL